MKPTAQTNNMSNAYEHSEDNYLEFFSKAGSLLEKRQSYYGNEASALELFKNAWRAGDNVLCMQLLMWLRDIRGGAGNRSGFRSIIHWMGEQYPEWIIANIDMIPQVGRWDDLKALYDTEAENAALEVWAKGLVTPSTMGLAAKWADRQDSKFRKFLGMSPKAYRKMLVEKTKVVEQQMCAGKWEEINYNQVPSVASTRYHKAFLAHDKDRYNEWKMSLAKPTAETGNKVNVGAIYPHDLIRSVNANCSSDYYRKEVTADESFRVLVNRQLQDMKNFIPEGQRIMCIADSSASMNIKVSGSVSAMDISKGLSLYCSEKVGKDNPFYRKYIPFSSVAQLFSWEDMDFVDAVFKGFDGEVASTNIRSAFICLLEAAKFFNATKDQMPTTILIISDMQFDHGGCSDRTPVQDCIDEWVKAGYDAPKIVYWNTAGYMNQPATVFDKNVAMVSGFSPSVLEAILGGEDFSPMAVLRKAVEKYSINVPEKVE